MRKTELTAYRGSYMPNATEATSRPKPAVANSSASAPSRQPPTARRRSRQTSGASATSMANPSTGPRAALAEAL
jgi:hypothetical protein